MHFGGMAIIGIFEADITIFVHYFCVEYECEILEEGHKLSIIPAAISGIIIS